MSKSRFPTLNWPLWLGLLIVLCVTIAACFGPLLAPRDPLEENRVVQSGERWYTPPFPAFSIAEFPLGSDRFGRDLLSQLLWAIRPTLMMVLLVAAVRLSLGLVIGLGAGWSEGRAGRQFDTLISGALAIPGLMIALVAIAAIGVELGIWAFIFGLSITGWAETAQIIREQTRMIKHQAYIEAAQACGASDFQIIATHVLRQLAPMIWMLLSFEVSNTLTTTAGLGFLGYYVGGDVWIVVADWVARRASGVPELGQMLATSRIRLDQPWGMVIVGSVIFIMVLGFNLLGEGLRLRLSLDRLSHYTFQTWVTDTLVPFLHIRLWTPALVWIRRSPLRAGLIALTGCLLLGAGLFWQHSQTEARYGPAVPAAEIAVPGGQL
jgi:ABC-type dipeptide/oligopeptide/nickel transport system permease subunit